MTPRKRGLETWQLAVFLCSFVACQLLPAPVVADDASAGTFGAPYLRIPVGAALMSVPDVVAGMNPDGSLAFSNPAMSAGVARGHVFFSRAAWLDDLSLNAASVVVPFPAYGLGFSFGSRLLHAGELRGYNSANEVVTEESYYGLALSGAMSREFKSLGLSVGAGLNYLRERLPVETGRGWSMSAGLSYTKGAHYASLFGQDLGGRISFEGRDYPLDSRYALGYGYALRRGSGRFDLGTQLVVSRSDLKRVQFGAVYHFPRYFVLRGGLDRTFDAPTTTHLPLSAGFGLRHGTMTLDYAYAPQEYFSNTHTFSIGWSFGAGGSMRQATPAPVLDARDPGPAAPPPSNAAAQAPPVRPAAAVNAREGSAPRGPETPAAPTQTYAVVAGSHSRAESARAEVRALQLLKVPAEVEGSGGRFTVVVGRYDRREDAKNALERYERQGHRFEIRPESR